MTSGIYLIRCKETNKVYVGSSKNIERRWQQHRSMLSKNAHHSTKLQYAWNKYGEMAFEFEIAEEVVDGFLLVVEQAWINKLDACVSGLNCAPCAGQLNHKEGELDATFRIRLTDTEKEKAERWAKYYSLALSTFIRWLIQLLPDDPPEIPKPSIKFPKP